MRSSMARKPNPSLSLARRHKRLQTWREQLLDGRLPAEDTKRFQQLFGEYSRQIAEAVSTGGEPVEERLAVIEREIATLFDLHRLMTSSIGVPAVTTEK